MWKELMVELKRIVKPSGAKLHRVAEIVRDLLANQEWLEEAHAAKRDRAEAELDRICRQAVVTLDELLMMVKWFPSVAEWADTDLVALKFAAFKKEDEDRAAKRRAVPRNAQPEVPLPPGAAGSSQEGPTLRDIAGDLESHFDSRLREIKERDDAEIKRLRGDLEKAESEINRLHKEVTRVQTELNAERGDKRRIAAELKKANGKIDKLEKKLSDRKSRR